MFWAYERLKMNLKSFILFFLNNGPCINMFLPVSLLICWWGVRVRQMLAQFVVNFFRCPIRCCENCVMPWKRFDPIHLTSVYHKFTFLLTQNFPEKLFLAADISLPPQEQTDVGVSIWDLFVRLYFIDHRFREMVQFCWRE